MIQDGRWWIVWWTRWHPAEQLQGVWESCVLQAALPLVAATGVALGTINIARWWLRDTTPDLHGSHPESPYSRPAAVPLLPIRPGGSLGAAWGRDAEFTERSRGGSQEQRHASGCDEVRVSGVLGSRRRRGVVAVVQRRRKVDHLRRASYIES
jgi:hypothetical protein